MSGTRLAIYVLATGFSLWAGLLFWRLGAHFYRQSTRLGQRPRSLWPVFFGTLFLAGVSGFLWKRPVFGLVFTAIFPGAYCGWAFVDRGRKQLCFERRFVSFLHGVLGLVRAGLSFSAAVRTLATESGDPFSRRVSLAWQRFEAGENLVASLERSTGRRIGGRVKLWWRLLGHLQKEGYPMVAAIERIVESWQMRLGFEERQRDLRQAVMGQALVAAVLPWFVLLALGTFEPGVLNRAFRSPLFQAILLGAIGWECLGVVVLWKAARF